MSIKSLSHISGWRGLGATLGIAVVGFLVVTATPAQALQAGCTCPLSTDSPDGGANAQTCTRFGSGGAPNTTVQATCPSTSTNASPVTFASTLTALQTSAAASDAATQALLEKQAKEAAERAAAEIAKQERERKERISKAAAEGSFGDWLVAMFDPYFKASTIRDNGSSFSNSSGFAASTVSSRTTELGTGATPVLKAFELGGGQRLTLGALFDYRSLRTGYGATPDLLAVGVGSSGSTRQDVYKAGGLLRYDFGSTYFGAAGGVDWGRASLTDTFGTGSYNTRGYTALGTVGHVFTLFEGARTANPRMITKATKAPQKPEGTNAVKLDVNAYFGRSWEQANGYTDSSGFVYGAEQLKFWATGASATLFTAIPSGRFTWTPSVGATIDSQFGTSHGLLIPAQGLLGADTVAYGGSGYTYLGGRAGLDVLDKSGWRFGLTGSYKQSSQASILSGRAYVLIPTSLADMVSGSPARP